MSLRRTNFLIFLFFTFILSGCLQDIETGGTSTITNDDDDSSTSVNSADFENSIEEALAQNKSTHEDDTDYNWESSGLIEINLNENSIDCSSASVSVNGSVATITAGGNYFISGSLTNGQLIVNSADENTVRLILNNVDIYCANSAPINIKAAEKTVVVLKDGTQSKLSDGATYTFASSDEDEPNATLFSKDDLSICGQGELTIDANYNDAISCKDGLVIKNGTYKITAADDAVRGKDYLVIKDGSFTIDATGDGFKSDNDEDAAKGYIEIVKGTFDIKAGADALQAQTDILVYDGNFNIETGGGSNKIGSDTYKGFKASVNVIIDAGTYDFNCADDALHCNGNLIINDGNFTISTADDGIHSDSTLVINNGIIKVTKSYEGIESAVVTINGGDITVTTSDDGINCAGGSDGSGGGGWPGGLGGPGQNMSSSTGNYCLYINGGNLTVCAGGDGLDSNGSIEMTGGKVIVHGPTESMNGPLDYDGTFNISGGFLVAVGSSGMAEAPSTSSSQYSVLCNFTSTYQAGNLVHIEDADGNNLVTLKPSKRYQSIAFSSSKLEKGESYSIYIGGSCTGTEVNGLYSDGEYSGGSEYTSFKVSGVTTKINSR